VKLLVIRGDLQSHSGHAASSRDFCRVFQGLFDRVVGVDIHYSKHLPFEPFPCPVVSDEEARRLAARADSALVLTYTTPDHFARYPNAACVGLTVWETDRLPPAHPYRRSWIERINHLDALWVESTHTRDLFKAAGVRVPIRLIPWPVRTSPALPRGLPEGFVYDTDRRPPLARVLTHALRLQKLRVNGLRWLTEALGARSATRFLHGIRRPSRDLPEPAEQTLVCVAQDVPRKGLLLLLSEWMEFKRRPEAARWSLLFRSYPCKEIRPVDFVVRFWSYVQALKRQLQVEQAKVYLWGDGLDDAQFEQLVANTWGCVSASLGEGFCGPAALALALGKPLLAPRHTSFLDLLPDDYPYTFASRPAHVRFVHSPSAALYHPASVWHVPEPFALVDSLNRLLTDDPVRREGHCRRARAHCLEFSSPECVRRLLTEEIERLQAGTCLVG
jgi:glycosyltransferase involved in cell wall biosynthesis